MQYKVDVIKVAITAAGGGPRVAREFGMSTAGVHLWIQRKSVPTERIRKLCELGQHTITTDRILAYIEECKLESEAA